MKFKNHYNAQPSKGEDKFEPSQTIPDQTMSIMEIMRRHAQGLPIDGAKVPVYHGEDDDMPDFSKMDLAEIQQYKYDAEIELQALRATIAEKETKAKEDKAKAAQEAKNRERNPTIEEAHVIEDKPEPKPNILKKPGGVKGGE